MTAGIFCTIIFGAFFVFLGWAGERIRCMCKYDKVTKEQYEKMWNYSVSSRLDFIANKLEVWIRVF